MEETEQMRRKIKELNRHRKAYYNQSESLVSDAEYDWMLDELDRLEKETGTIYADSPTQKVGYYPEGSLERVRHEVPLLSLDKTKSVIELAAFVKKNPALLMLKLDGLTVKLTYEKGKLVGASTRGDGETGEDIFHNVRFMKDIPVNIPYEGKLVLSGEAFIRKDDFEILRRTLRNEKGEPPKNGRNLASGSVQSKNSRHCEGRHVRFLPFNVLEGMEREWPDSREMRLSELKEMGFSACPYVSLEPETVSAEKLEEWIAYLKTVAQKKELPIDGLVAVYDSYKYSESLGRTEKFYRNGLAFKFGDDGYETTLRKIEWTPSRFGELAPVAVFEPVEIDGCSVARATLHNLTVIKELELVPGSRILVSKRNQIIPHVEGNLSRGNYVDTYPLTCPCCGKPTRVYARKISAGKIVETLHCDNPDCDSQILRKFVHFAAQKAMNIEGLSETVLKRFLELGWLTSFQDIYYLCRHRKEMLHLDGFGVKSYERLMEAIAKSRHTDFAHYLTAMDIPMIGRTKSRVLSRTFHGNLEAFAEAAAGNYDFSQLEDFGKILNDNIHAWFADEENRNLWEDLQIEMIFQEEETEEMNMSERKENPFNGCTVVATGKLENFTRDGINRKIMELGGVPGSSVTRKTDYLICGEKAGSKLTKAQQLGVKVLSENEFLEMAA